MTEGNKDLWKVIDKMRDGDVDIIQRVTKCEGRLNALEKATDNQAVDIGGNVKAIVKAHEAINEVSQGVGKMERKWLWTILGGVVSIVTAIILGVIFG